MRLCSTALTKRGKSGLSRAAESVLSSQCQDQAAFGGHERPRSRAFASRRGQVRANLPVRPRLEAPCQPLPFFLPGAGGDAAAASGLCRAGGSQLRERTPSQPRTGEILLEDFRPFLKISTYLVMQKLSAKLLCRVPWGTLVFAVLGSEEGQTRLSHCLSPSVCAQLCSGRLRATRHPRGCRRLTRESRTGAEAAGSGAKPHPLQQQPFLLPSRKQLWDWSGSEVDQGAVLGTPGECGICPSRQVSQAPHGSLVVRRRPGWRGSAGACPGDTHSAASTTCWSLRQTGVVCRWAGAEN